MITVLSSRLTPFFKFLFPTLLGGFWSYFTARMFIEPGSVIGNGGSEAPSWSKWIFLAFLVLGGVICARVCFPLKRVILDDEFLVVSNYIRSARIPLRKVVAGGVELDAEVEVWGTVGPIGMSERRPLVALEFSDQTAFGRLVEFIPRSEESIALLRKRLGGPTAGPIVQESQLAEELRGRGTL